MANVMRRSRLGGLGRLDGRFWVMNGSHAGGLEFGEVEAKFVFHAGEGGGSQAVTSDVVRVDGGQL